MDRSSSSSNGQSAPPPFSPETVSSMLGNVKFDPSTYRPVLPPQNNDNLEYLYVDDALPFPTNAPVHHPSGSWGPLPMRTDGDKMLYGTGTAYMLGLSSGGLYGFVRGLQHPMATTFKLKINSVLNLCTRYGPWAGNHAGILALAYTSLDSLLGKYRDVKDYSNHILAAFTTGVIFKSTAGFRQAIVMGSTLGTGVVLYGMLDAYRKGELEIPGLKLGTVEKAGDAGSNKLPAH
ncbi:Tim17/Tim22/Tim23/Pmp24 family-domain-containing protein [Hyaloraphidium curvatum]|nr:Tim17/Tim22/Tim23/Pmp24 family-domain-containing protein [Hyaloraphidium curvatum]